MNQHDLPSSRIPFIDRLERHSAWAHHVVLRAADERVLWSTVAERRAATRALLRHARAHGVVGFRLADTHMHAIVLADRSAAGRFAHDLGAALCHASARREHYRLSLIKAVRDLSHLRNAARYLVKQEEHHQLDRDPLHDGSSLPDVLGLRVVDPGFAQHVQRALPRIGRADWLSWAGWQGLDRAPLALDALAEASAAAIGRADLEGEAWLTTAARRAAAHVARSAGLAPARIGEALGIARRTATDALSRTPNEALTRAIEGQLRLRALLGAQALGSSGRG